MIPPSPESPPVQACPPRRVVRRRPTVASPATRALVALVASVTLAAMLAPRPLAAQLPVAAGSREVLHVSLSPGRAYPLTLPGPVGKLSVTDPEIADAVVISEREIVLNGKKAGETDVLVWIGTTRRHYRVSVASPGDRAQVVLSIKIAEVRRDALTELGISARGRSSDARRRVGTGELASDNAVGSDGVITIPGEAGFLTTIARLGTRDVLAFLEAQERQGMARTLAEPTLMAGNRDSASFLAGGEIPIPIAQPSAGGQPTVTVVYREFGVRLAFMPEVLSDSLVKLKVRPEVSSLDYANALVLSGFRIPALRTRRIESTVDVQQGRSLVISGLFNDERERVRTGVPLLMRIPLLGALFSSTRWQRSETELLIVVTPTIVDPNRPRPQDLVPLVPRDSLPARDALAPRLPPAPKRPTAPRSPR